MRLTIPRGELLAALTKAGHVSDKSAKMPILAHTLLEAGADGLTVTATDLDAAICVAIGGKILEPGALAAPARTLLDIVKKLPDAAEVALELDAATAQLQISAGRARFRVPTLPADTFPRLTPPDSATVFEIAGGELARMLKRTLPAVDRSEVRFYLAGVHLHALPGKILRAVATNGHVLALAQTELAVEIELAPGVVIVPEKAARELMRLGESFAGALRLTISPSMIEAAAGDTIFVSKLIDGTFPDYQRVIPDSEGRSEIVAELDQLRAAVDRVAIVGLEKEKWGARIRFAFEPGRVTLSTTAPDAGSAEEELALEYDGEPFEIAFGHRYLMAAADALDCETVKLEMSGPGDPAVIRPLPASPELFVLMPQRL